MIRWQTGLAEVTTVNGKHITVDCPHCGKQHQHNRAVLGSYHVVAGCHAGHGRLREYRIPEHAVPNTEQLEPFRKTLKRNTVRAAA
ncbi:hypothetical protein [Mycolicibacterium vaccae]|uniref:hypothetical protein n=1 Tax=Mycolicibacterium vaccae TaxID=1810 RepID=UPI003D0191CF